MFPGLALDLPVSRRLQPSPQAFALALRPIRTNMQPMNAATGGSILGSADAATPEIWLASALLAVTFRFLIYYDEFFKMWPPHRGNR
jgi:hypothetical protein